MLSCNRLFPPLQAYISHTDWFATTQSTDHNWSPDKGGSNRFATIFLYFLEDETRWSAEEAQQLLGFSSICGNVVILIVTIPFGLWLEMLAKKKIEVHESQGPTTPQIQDDPEVLEMARYYYIFDDG